MEKINKRGRVRLTDDEWNAITKLTATTHLDQSGFDIYALEDEDCFVDYEDDYDGSFQKNEDGGTLVPLYDGLHILNDTISAYPLKENGLNKKEAKLICNLLIEYGITDDKEYIDWLMSEKDVR